MPVASATKTVMLVLINNRKDAAVTVQKILTGWGCLIKTRLGIHEGTLENCSNHGLLILELVGDQKKIEGLHHKLSLVKGVSVKMQTLEVAMEEAPKAKVAKAGKPAKTVKAPKIVKAAKAAKAAKVVAKKPAKKK